MAILPGTRIRDNGVFGTITDNPLTAGATTFNSANLALLSVVASDHALVTLDPLREHGAPEIVMVTAHTAAATVATIQRGMFGTVARSHPQGSLWVHAAADNDFREVVTSSTRPSDQYEGQPIYETDTDRLVSFTGSVWQQEGLFFDPPACRVFHNTTQSIPNNTLTNVLFNSETYDTDGMHSTSSLTDRVVINTPGIYVMTGVTLWNGDNDYTEVLIRLMLNDITEISQMRLHALGNAGPRIVVPGQYKFAVSDFITLNVRQINTSGNANDILANTSLTVTWIGRGN